MLCGFIRISAKDVPDGYGESTTYSQAFLRGYKLFDYASFGDCYSPSISSWDEDALNDAVEEVMAWLELAEAA